MPTVEAQVEAQGEAQDASRLLPEIQEMPTGPAIDAAADAILAALGRAGLSSATLAREAGITEGALSRVLSGQYRVTLDIWRCAWRLTRDPALLDLLATSDSELVAVRRVPVPDEQAAYMESVHAAQDLHLAAHAAIWSRPGTLSGHQQQGGDIAQAERRALASIVWLARSAQASLSRRRAAAEPSRPRLEIRA